MTNRAKITTALMITTTATNMTTTIDYIHGGYMRNT